MRSCVNEKVRLCQSMKPLFKPRSEFNYRFPSVLCGEQGVGSGLPDASLPAKRHLVLGPDVPVRSISAPGLPLLLPEHGPGPPHHHPALQPCQEGRSVCTCVCVFVLNVYVSVHNCGTQCAHKYCAQGQKDYGRCLRLSQCCGASSSSSPDSVKGAALRSNSRYTSSQARRATANRQVQQHITGNTSSSSIVLSLMHF